jgi:cytochrome P450
MNEQILFPEGAPLFNPLTPDFIADPYPFYRRLRKADPMHLTPLGFHVASRHADVTAILRDKRFGKDFVGRMSRRSGPQILEEPVYRSMSHWMLQLDPPDMDARAVSWSAPLPRGASRTCARAFSKSSMRSSIAWSRAAGWISSWTSLSGFLLP